MNKRNIRNKKTIKNTSIINNKNAKKTRRVIKRKIKGGTKRHNKIYTMTNIMHADPFFLDKTKIFNKYKDDLIIDDDNNDKSEKINPYENHPYMNIVSNYSKTDNNTDIDNMLILAMPYNNNKDEYTKPLSTQVYTVKNVLDGYNTNIDDYNNNTDKKNKKNKIIDYINSSSSILLDPSYLKQKEIYNKYNKTQDIENFDNIPVNHRTIFHTYRENDKPPDYTLRNFFTDKDNFSDNYLSIEPPMAISSVKYTDKKR